MPADERLSPVQFFEYHDVTETYGESRPTHQVRAYGGKTGTLLGAMTWDARHVRNINVGPGFQRRGVATALWQEGHRVAGEQHRVPTPKHSNQRTTAGDAWARSVGGRLPRRH